MKRSLRAILAAGALAVGALTATAVPAQADGDSCVLSRDASVSCIAVYGSGKYVDQTATSAAPQVNFNFSFCGTQAHNWHSNQTYREKWSGVDGRCVVAPRIVIPWKTTLSGGSAYMYAEMIVSGSSLRGYPGVYIW